jgi:hypothetical protein
MQLDMVRRFRIRRGILAAALPAFLLALPPLEARDCRVNLLPNGTKFGCANCHLSAAGGGARNPFGLVVGTLVTAGSCTGFWSATLAAQDADKDGRSNGTELGDPAGTWRPGMPNTGIAAEVSNPGVPNPKFIRGDSNADGNVDISDAQAILEFLFRAAAVPTCRSSADANNSGAIDISDALFVLLHLFSERGVDPQPPYPSCGIEVLTDSLDCKSFLPCP